VVHWTDKHARALLFFLAAALVMGIDAVAGLRLGPATFLLEEFLLLAMASRALLGLLLAILRLLRRGLHLRLGLLRSLSLLELALRLLSGLLTRFVFATTPAAPMSLRLSLAIRLGRPHF
jgi:hypothetical protein